MTEEEQVTTTLRLPADLKRWLHHEAIEQFRSLNSEIVHRLKQSRAQQESKKEAQP